MAAGWMTIRVELVGGHGEVYDPGPGRVLLVGPEHTFADLAEAINVAFGRWDHAHLYEFTLADGRRLGEPSSEDEPDRVLLIDAHEHLVCGTLTLGERLRLLFDFGDCWLHDGEVAADGVDPLDAYGRVPRGIVPVWGWGELPDQYQRRWDGDDGQTDLPPGFAVDEEQVAFRTAGIDVRISAGRAEGAHLADARPAEGYPAGRPATGRLTQADEDFAVITFRDPPEWLAQRVEDPGPCRPGTLQRAGTGVCVLVPQPFRQASLLPWLKARQPRRGAG